MNPDRPTMEDVAARAGVSRALVSIVFRQVPGASESTRRHVLNAAEELGYQPDRRASRLGLTVLPVRFWRRTMAHGKEYGRLLSLRCNSGGVE